jgi:hypothetical protein
VRRLAVVLEAEIEVLNTFGPAHPAATPSFFSPRSDTR